MEVQKSSDIFVIIASDNILVKRGYWFGH